MDFALLIAGLAGLWLGTELAIRGAVSVANRYGVSEFIVGAIILSIGSDLPELAIAVGAGLKNLAGGQFSDVVVGSAIGSSLGQIGFVLGFVGLLAHLTLPKGVVVRHGGILLGSLLLVGWFGLDGHVSFAEGAVLLIAYGVYFVALLKEVDGADKAHTSDMSLARSIVYLAVGLFVVIGGAELTVSSAVAVALQLGLSDAVVAVILIGLGSSLPELTISVAAVMKGFKHMSVGNLVGSNVFDTLVPIGVAAIIAPLAFDEGMLWFDLPYLFFVTAIALVFFWRNRGIRRVEGSIVLSLYLVYVLIKLGGSFLG